MLTDLKCKYDIFIATFSTLHRLSILKHTIHDFVFNKDLGFDLRFGFRRFEIWIKYDSRFKIWPSDLNHFKIKDLIFELKI